MKDVLGVRTSPFPTRHCARVSLLLNRACRGGGCRSVDVEAQDYRIGVIGMIGACIYTTYKTTKARKSGQTPLFLNENYRHLFESEQRDFFAWQYLEEVEGASGNLFWGF